jgi:hypothetical protein
VKDSASSRTSFGYRRVIARNPFPNGSRAIGRSRFVSTAPQAFDPVRKSKLASTGGALLLSQSRIALFAAPLKDAV